MYSRSSFAKRANRELKESKATTNIRVAKAAGIKSGILLLGGRSTIDFQVRVAQRRMRSDLLPSFWSDAMILAPDGTVYGARLHDLNDVSSVARENGIGEYQLADFTSTKAYPNFALISFYEDELDLGPGVEMAKQTRSSLDLPGLLVKWLGYLWGVEGYDNPVTQNIGVPSAALVETVCADAGLDVTPGLANQASTPEAIWQAAKWWQDYYKEADDQSQVRTCQPRGAYAIRDENPTIVE